MAGACMDNRLFEFYSSFRCKDVEWLWYPYIPYGKITVLQGDPGEGKSTFILNVAALLTKGKPMPEEDNLREPQTGIYQCAEDGVADTIKPRLVAAGADGDKAAYIIDEEENLTLDDVRIKQTVKETHARFLIIDPIQAFVAQDGDMQNAVKSRNVLRKLSAVAAKYNCAIVLIGHMNKGSGGKSLYRGLGSIDIAAIARSVLMITRDQMNPSIRYMIPIKSSLAAEGSAIAFQLDGEQGFAWIGKCDVDITAVDDEPSLSKKELARQYLLKFSQTSRYPAGKLSITYRGWVLD